METSYYITNPSPHSIAEWHKNVYHTSKADVPPEWKDIRAEAIRRDRYTCYRCRKKFRVIELTVHHIVSRAKGGANELCNLITMCADCHDIVETEGYETLYQIRRSYTTEEDTPVESKPIDLPKDVDPDDWHVWVYGCRRRRVRAYAKRNTAKS